MGFVLFAFSKKFLVGTFEGRNLGCKSGVVVEKFGIVGLGRRKHGVKVAIVFGQLLILFQTVCRGSFGKDSRSFKDVVCFGLFHTANFGIRRFGSLACVSEQRRLRSSTEGSEAREVEDINLRSEVWNDEFKNQRQ